MVWFWALVAPAILLALASLRGERSRLHGVRATLAETAPPPEGWPAATVIVPVKGPEEGLARNLAALAALDYPDYELLIAIRQPVDLPEGVAPDRARVVVASPGHDDTGEKIQNLLAAVAEARPDTAVFAFADSDVAVNRGWLRALVRALSVPDAAAATGYRWHAPRRAGFWPLLRSVWDGVVLGMFQPGRAPFAWGGSIAITRREFERLRIARRWQGAVSDDYVLTQAVHSAGRRVAFAPGALSADTSSITGGVFLSWIRRQLILTRIHRPRLWTLSLIAHLIYCGAMLACLLAAWRGYPLALLPLAVQLGIGMWKAANRARLAAIALDAGYRQAWAHVWLTPLATWVWLYALLASATTNRIRWRNRIYELRR